MKEDFKQYLSRVYSQDFIWDPAAVTGTLIARVSFPNFLFSVPAIWDKLQNFTYFRAGVKVGIRMNGSKFHYGQVLVSWSPMGENTSDLHAATNNIYSASSFPCFTLSPSENEVHEFILPYALPYNYIPLVPGGILGPGSSDDFAFQFGVIHIYVLNPLLCQATVTPVSFTLFANFVDVDIAGYTEARAFTRPTRIIGTQADHPAILPPVPFALSEARPSKIRLQAQGKKMNTEAAKKSEKGVIGKIAETVGTIASALIPIPEVGEIAGVVSMGAAVVGAIANVFGWILPNSLRAMQPVKLSFANIANTHGLNDNQMIGIDPENAVGSGATLMGSNSDEMSLMHIVSTPGLICAGAEWSNSMPPFATIYAAYVHPQFVMHDGTNFVNYPTLLSHTSSAFKMWRGSIRYHISVVSSQMHVGRIRISWSPTSNFLLDSTQLLNTAGVIVDISKQTDITVTIPYLHFRPWLDIFNPQTYPQTDSSNANSNGVLVISVLNELNHPSSPVPPVYVNVWAFAGPDYQLALPSEEMIQNNWYIPPTPEPLLPALKAQGLTREQIRSDHAPTLIPGFGGVDSDLVHGETVQHLKELLLRPMFWSSVKDELTTGDSVPVVFTNIINPYGAIPHSGDPVPVVFEQNQVSNFWWYFKQIFRYSRGSISVRFLQQNNTFQNMQGSGGYAWDRGASYLFNRVERLAGTLTADQAIWIREILADGYIGETSLPSGMGMHYAPTAQFPQSACLPFYSSNYFYPNFGVNGANTPTTSIYGTMPKPELWVTCSGTIVLAAGDDVEFGFLVGPPALTVHT